MGYKVISGIIFLFAFFVFTETANANNKIFFQKNVIGIGLVFIEANTDHNKSVGDPTTIPLRHDYFSLLRKSGWKIASSEYQDVVISCLIEENHSSDSVLVSCYNNNPSSNILMLVTTIKDSEIESYIRKTIQLMIDKMIEHKPSPQEPSRVPDFFYKISLQFL